MRDEAKRAAGFIPAVGLLSRRDKPGGSQSHTGRPRMSCASSIFAS